MKDLKKKLEFVAEVVRKAEYELSQELDTHCDEELYAYNEALVEDLQKASGLLEEVKAPKVYVLYTEKACDGSFNADFALFSTQEKAMEEFEKYVHKIGLFAKDYKWGVERSEMRIEAHDDDYVDRFKAEVKALEVD